MKKDVSEDLMVSKAIRMRQSDVKIIQELGDGAFSVGFRFLMKAIRKDLLKFIDDRPDFKQYLQEEKDAHEKEKGKKK